MGIPGPVRESYPGPVTPKARIMPLDQQAVPVTDVGTNSQLSCYTDSLKEALALGVFSVLYLKCLLCYHQVSDVTVNTCMHDSSIVF